MPSYVCARILSLLGMASYSLETMASGIRYALREDGETRDGSSFQRFAAFSQESGQTLTTADWTEALEDGDTSSLNTVLAAAPYRAFYFEVPPVTSASAPTQPFEFVLVEAKSLAHRKPRFRSFEDPCEKSSIANDFGCVFPNLSGDAMLIVPTPQDGVSDQSYTHLANFIRQAPPPQVEALWKLVARAYRNQWSGIRGGRNSHNNDNVWLSTAGNGVPWLHFRLDSAPKYYRYQPYKMPIVQEYNGDNLPPVKKSRNDLEDL